jgi:hypothetical protein
VPRIPLKSDPEVGPLTRLGFRFARRRFGEVPEPFRAAAHHPGLMWASAVLARYPDSAAFTHDEKLALAYADAMTAQPITVTYDLVARRADQASKLRAGSGRGTPVSFAGLSWSRIAVIRPSA